MSKLKELGYKIDLALDNRIKLAPKQYTVFKTGENITIQQTAAQTFSNQSVIWNIIPSNSTWIDRRFRILCSARITLSNPGGTLPPGFTGILAPGPDGSLGGLDGLRWGGICAQAQSCNLSINNGNIATSPVWFYEPLSRYYQNNDYQSWMSTMPSMHDTAQKYSISYQTAKDPLAGYFDNSSQMPRGSSCYYTIISNTATEAVIDCTWEEPFCCSSPMLFPDEQKTGLYGINTIMVNMTFVNSLSKIWSHDAVNGAPVSNVTFAWNKAPIMELYQISNPGSIATPDIEKVLPFQSIVVYPEAGAIDLASGATDIKPLNNIKLIGTPSRLYIFVRKSDGTMRFTDCDCYALITNIQITYGNKSALLGNLSPHGLFQLSKSNGFAGDYGSWCNSGSVLCINFETDISQDLLSAVGMEGQQQFQVNLTYKNISPGPETTTYQIYTIAIYEGIFNYSDNTAKDEINVLKPADLTRDEVLNATQSRAAHISSNFMGGSFRESATKVARKAYDLGKEYIPKARKAIGSSKNAVSSGIGVFSPRAAAAYEMFANLVGTGMTERQACEHMKKHHGFTTAELRAAGVHVPKPRAKPKPKPKAKGLTGGAKKPKTVAKARKGRGLSGGYLIDDDSDAEDLLSGRY
jgi:hypothetical protein